MVDYILTGIENIADRKFCTGDRILIDRVYQGSIKLNRDNCEGNIEITSSSSKTALIDAGNDCGIFVENLSHIKIDNLTLRGSGRTINSGHGIHIENSCDTHQGDIVISRVDVSGFRDHGILVYSTYPQHGYNGVRIENAISYDNGRSGITVSAEAFPDLPHSDILVSRCVAHHNLGIAGQPTHTGSGIVISGFRNGVIEYSEAFENGALCDATESGGPVGIWAYNCDGGIIRYNKSHHNHSNNSADGGGFDLDGGACNCVMHDNVSWANDGYGYQVWDFFWGKTEHNEIYHNVSIEDCQAYDFGTFVIFGKVVDCKVHHNVAHARPGKKLIQIEKWSGSNLNFYNNTYVANGSVIPLSQDNECTGSGLRMAEESVLIGN